MLDYGDQIIMFMIGLFATNVGANISQGLLTDRMGPSQRKQLCKALTMLGPILMAGADLIAALQFARNAGWLAS